MSDLTTDEYNTARVLLADIGPDATAARHIPAPGPVAPGIAPLVVPEGYTVRERYRTNPDGSAELIREVVPLEAAPQAAAPRPTAPTAPVHAPIPSAITERRTLPEWLQENRLRLKAATCLAGGAAVTTVGAVYGNDIASGVSAGADALWGATVTVLKFTGIVLGIAVGVGLFCRIVFGGGKKPPRGGTFEGSIKGTWR
ncbi:hypothetical protein ABT039_22870 [Streptomyces lasiicapitis]|uniref:hypothetical protein n=1 Tax=Streptomyces lasiicapitis TaxID=1923961 RepID=UPI003317C0CE